MATKDDIIAWGEASNLFDKGKYQEAANIFGTIAGSIGAKIQFNIGMCFGALKRNNDAIEAFTSAVKADKYFAAAYFQRGYFQVLNNAFGKAVQDYSFAFEHLRGNQLIDYTQLGLPYQLYLSEVLYNRALCKVKLNDANGAYQDLVQAQQMKALDDHDKIDETLRTQKYGAPFFIPNLIYTPPEQKLKNAVKVDFLGNSKIVATVDENDTIIGFKDAHLRKMAQGREAAISPPPAPISRPPPPSSGPPSSGPPPPAAGPPPSRPPPPQSRPPGSGPSPPSSGGGFAPPSRPPPSSGPPGQSFGRPAPPPQNAPPQNSSSPQNVPRSTAPPAATGGFPAPSSLPSGTKIKVKCHYHDTRVVLIEEGVRFEEFLRRVQEKFDGAKLKMKYKDEDQDLIILGDQEDLEMALTLPDVASGKMEVWCS